MVDIKIYTTGGTIDKIYFDRKDTYGVGGPAIGEVLKEANAGFAFEIESPFQKDSLDMTDADRQLLYDRICEDPARRVVISHGTDTMIQTARKLAGIADKVIVLTGALSPARFKSSDAVFNIGAAVAAVQLLAPGVYIVMNGSIFDPRHVRKNLALNRFEHC